MSRSIRVFHFLPIALSVALCAGFCLSPRATAQQAAAERPAAPVPLVPAPPASPEVQPDGSVSFRLEMPNAAKVDLHLDGTATPIPLSKDASGIWGATVPKIAPEYYSYWFSVDGAPVLDPHNQTIKASFFSTQNVFLVPGQPPMPWEAADVPHGVIHHHSYRSKIVGINSEYFVYTPPGFSAQSKQKYPVLYLFHGYSDDPSAWTFMGKADVILDNLIAQGRAKPMIVVMPLGYGTMEMIARGWSAWRDPELVSRNFATFGNALYQEVMPAVKQQYPLSDKREDHAIAGLSMGGAESLLVGLNHTDDFAYVGGFSAGGLGSGPFAPAFQAVTPASAAKLNAKLRVLWIACGTEDGLFGPNEKLVGWLKEQGLQPDFHPSPGLHVWMLWREDLTKFLPLLFQAK